MKIINKYQIQKYIAVLLLFGMMICFAGCGVSYDMPYTVNSATSSFRIVNREEEALAAVPFAAELCVTEANVNTSSVDMSNASGAALFDINSKETIYAKNVHDKLYPAPLTKVMTALVALKHGSTDMLLTASSNVTNLEADAQTCGLKEGDQISVTTKNNSKTLSQTLKSIYYEVKGEDLHIIASTSTGTIAVNGAI